MSNANWRVLVRDGLWTNNPGLVQLLGLCPLLAVSATMVNGLGLGIATTLTLLASNVTVSAIRHLVPPEIRIPVFVLVIASAVTIIELALRAWFYELYLVLGIFIPLIVTNCAIIGRAEAFASRHGVLRSLVDALSMGAGFTLVLVALGALRELIGYGTLLREAQLMFGAGSEWLTVRLAEGYRGVLLAVLPPGAFIGLGLLIALKNSIDARRRRGETVAVLAGAQPAH